MSTKLNDQDYQWNVRYLLALKLLLSCEFSFSVTASYYAQAGLSLSQVGFLWGLQFAALFCTDIPSSALADRFGYRSYLLIGTAAWAAGILILAAHLPTITEGVIGNLFIGIGRAFCGCSLEAFANQNLARIKNPRSYLVFGSHGALMFGLGEVGAGLTSAALVHYWPTQGMRLAFGLQGAVLAGSFILVAWGIKALPTAKVRAPQGSTTPKFRLHGLPRWLRGHAKLLPYIAYGAVISSALQTAALFLTPHLQALTSSPFATTITVASLYLTYAASSIFTQAYERWLGEQRVVASLLGLIAVAYLLLWLVPGWVSISGFLVMYFVMTVHYVVYNHYLMKLKPVWRALMISSMLGVANLMSIGLNPLFGWAAQHYGLPTTWLISMLIHVPAGAIFLAWMRLRPIKPTPDFQEATTN